MRYLFFFWFLPLGLFWGWFGLSYHDINFGTLFLSRQMHDIVFQIYGNILQVEPATIVGLLVKACVVDSLIIFAILAFRRRKKIIAWWNGRKAATSVEQTELYEPATPAE